MNTPLTSETAAPAPPPAREGASVTIEYCVPGNHENVARRLAAAIQKEFGLAAALVPSRGGAFEVTVDGRLVFSKRATSRFPDPEEIFYHLLHRPV